MQRKEKLLIWAVLLTVFPAVVVALVYELRTSWLQARLLSRVARQAVFRVEAGPSPAIRFPEAGPYDERLGYVDLPAITRRLEGAGLEVTGQARLSPELLRLSDFGLFPVYREKSQAGLRLEDRSGAPLFAASFPARVYPDFEAIPPIIVEVLLFIENRELLDPRFPFRNPAVEWDRLAKAVLDLGIRVVDPDRAVPGGSTLATQIEKFRHSPGGMTASAGEKLRQMAAASPRSYREGEETLPARERIVLDYINSIPLSAIPGYGEIIGLGDGLYAWYGVDFEDASRQLARRPAGPNDPKLATWARACKQVVSLFVAQRRPSFYLAEDPAALEAKANSYVRLLADAGVLRAWERDEALRQEINLKREAAVQPTASFLERKAANAVRTRLLALLGVPQLYRLDRLDLEVQCTLDQERQQAVSEVLMQLRDPAYARAAGLYGFRLLADGDDPAAVVYSFTLYERTEGANLLRIQTDNYDQPLDINAGVKLELGSSAKLRTLVSYLEIVAELHDRYAAFSPAELAEVQTAAPDRLRRWALDWLAGAPDRSLAAMLAAAMERRYSADPNERFYTGGGVHTFVNFDHKHDAGVYSVQEAFNNSINLVFIRMMRDILRYYMYQIPGVVELLADVDDPRRQEYLARFADKEGGQFLQRFYRKYRGKEMEEALDIVLQNVRLTPVRLAAIFRYLRPEAERGEFSAFLHAQLPGSALTAKEIGGLYEKYAEDAWSLVDRGYIARVHPLELWLVRYLRAHPEAGLSEIMAAGAEERQVVYTWLFRTSRKNRQDIRIRTLLEMEAFGDIHAAWKRLRYPFDSLVPSYATAIGSSADRPAALAELVGIILSEGRWYPPVLIEELRFAEDTPYETSLSYRRGTGEQVLHPEVAARAREALLGVVDRGTAHRLYGVFRQEDATPLAVGGKTGTGDNRREIYGAGGQLLRSKVLNRTAVFVFFLGDRFFGTITAYVPGPQAGSYRFTSSLPVQVLKTLAPYLNF